MVSLPRIIPPSALTTKPTNRRTLPDLFSPLTVIAAVLTRQPFPLGLLEIRVPIHRSTMLLATRTVTRQLPAVHTRLFELMPSHAYNFVTNLVNFCDSPGKVLNRKIYRTRQVFELLLLWAFQNRTGRNKTKRKKEGTKISANLQALAGGHPPGLFYIELYKRK